MIRDITLTRRVVFLLCLAIIGLGVPVVSNAQNAVIVTVTLKAHRFDPREVRAPKDTPFILRVRNLDPTAAEFESKTLRVEKIVPPNGTVELHIRPLQPGRYRFFDDFHEATAEGFLIVE